jgi:hypothetical protein
MMAIEEQPPEVLALLLADYVHQDDSTRKLFILGTRSLIEAAAFPWTQPQLATYAALTDGRSATTVQLRLVDVEEARPPVLEHETVLMFSDPTAEVEVVFFLTDLVFPEPGEYRIQLHAAGQLLRERRFLVTPRENPDQL